MNLKVKPYVIEEAHGDKVLLKKDVGKASFFAKINENLSAESVQRGLIGLVRFDQSNTPSLMGVLVGGE